MEATRIGLHYGWEVPKRPPTSIISTTDWDLDAIVLTLYRNLLQITFDGYVVPATANLLDLFDDRVAFLSNANRTDTEEWDALPDIDKMFWYVVRAWFTTRCRPLDTRILKEVRPVFTIVTDEMLEGTGDVIRHLDYTSADTYRQFVLVARLMTRLCMRHSRRSELDGLWTLITILQSDDPQAIDAFAVRGPLYAHGLLCATQKLRMAFLFSFLNKEFDVTAHGPITPPLYGVEGGVETEDEFRESTASIFLKAIFGRLVTFSNRLVPIPTEPYIYSSAFYLYRLCESGSPENVFKRVDLIATVFPQLAELAYFIAADESCWV